MNASPLDRMHETKQHPVLAPFNLAGLNLKNRAAVAPLSRVSTRGDGIATKQIARYDGAFAQGDLD